MLDTIHEVMTSVSPYPTPSLDYGSSICRGRWSACARYPVHKHYAYSGACLGHSTYTYGEQMGGRMDPLG